MDPAPPPIPVEKRPGMAVASLGFGIFSILTSWICIGFLAAIPAIILGHSCRSKLEKAGRTQGANMAMTGLLLGYIAIGLTISLSTITVLTLLGGQINEIFQEIQADLEHQSGS